MTTDKGTVKISDQIVAIDDLVVPKPISCYPVDPVIVTEIPSIEKQIKSTLKVTTVEVENIKKVTVSKNTNKPVYHVTTTNDNGEEVEIELVYDPNTQTSTVINVGIVKGDPVLTTTEVKPVTGVEEVTITSTVTIKKTK